MAPCVSVGKGLKFQFRCAGGRRVSKRSAARHAIVVVRGPNRDHAARAQSGDAPAEAHELCWVLRIVVLLVVADRGGRGCRGEGSHPCSGAIFVVVVVVRV